MKELIKNNRIEGFDYLRAIMSCFIVIWHMGGGGESLIFSANRYLEHEFTVSDFVNFHILLLAVPIFIFISCYLYILKGVSIVALKKRIKRILILLTFWPIAFIIFNYSYHGLQNFLISILTHPVIAVLTAGDTIYYFFVSLMMCLLITHVIAKLNLRFQIFGFVLSVISLSILPSLTKVSGFYPLSAYWNPLNFIPLTFAAVLVAQNMNYIRSKIIIIMSFSMILCFIFSIFEWNYSVGYIFFPGQGYAIPAYTRSSLAFGVIVVALLATDARIKSNRIVRYMSKYSLALFCLHPFLMRPIIDAMAKIVQNELILTYGSIIFVILSSYAIAMVLRVYLKDQVII